VSGYAVFKPLDCTEIGFSQINWHSRASPILSGDFDRRRELKEAEINRASGDTTDFNNMGDGSI